MCGCGRGTPSCANLIFIAITSAGSAGEAAFSAEVASVGLARQRHSVSGCEDREPDAESTEGPVSTTPFAAPDAPPPPSSKSDTGSASASVTTSRSIFGIFKKVESSAAQLDEGQDSGVTEPKEEFTFSNDHATMTAGGSSSASSTDKTQKILQNVKPAMRRMSMAGEMGGRGSRRSSRGRDSNASTLSDIGDPDGEGDNES